MAHIITIEVGEGRTPDCSECPFNNFGYEEEVCGVPDIFPDCTDVDYSKMELVSSDVV